MKTIKTSEYPIRYLCNKNLGVIIENEIQKNRGGYELLQYYNTHGKGNVSAELSSYQGEGFLVSVHAEFDRADIRDKKQVGFAEIYYNYESAKKIILNKIEFYEKWVTDHVIWRMSRKKYRSEAVTNAKRGYVKELKKWKHQSKKYQFMNEVLNPIKSKQYIIDCLEKIYMKDHKNEVEDAIKRGENVPEKVLKEYGLEVNNGK